MLNKLRNNIEKKRKSKNLFWVKIIEFKDFIAWKVKGKKSIKVQFKEEVRFYKSFIKENDLIFDVGANLGEKTEVFLKCNAKVVSIEPQSECISVLQKKFHNNNNVIIVANGLASKSGKSTIYTSESSNTVSTFSKEWQKGRFENQIMWGGEEVIEMITIENLIEKHGVPMFCKVDVEGYELEVFKGLKTKIPVVSFEFAEEFLHNTLQIIEILTKIGYTEFNFAENEQTYFNNIKWLSKESLIMYFNKNIKVERKEIWGDIYAR